MKCYICFTGIYPEYEPMESIKEACYYFKTVADELAAFDQTIEASVHIADIEDTIAEYPDYVLSRGIRGGIVKQRT